MARGSGSFLDAPADEVGRVVPVRCRPWQRWAAVGLAVAVIVAAGIAVGRGLARSPVQASSPLIGRPAPIIGLVGLDGEDVASSDWAGRIYVVNFWASWCLPCRKEAPHLQAFWERHRDEGVMLIGIAFEDEQAKAQEFRDELGLTYPQAMDPTGRAADDFGVVGLPETYVVDQHGVVKAKLVGAVGPTTLDEVLAKVQAGDTYTSTPLP